MRAFVSIGLPAEVSEHLRRVQTAVLSKVAEKLQATNASSLHLTLKFPGEMEPATLSTLVESLRTIRRSGPVLLQAQELECFPQRDAMRVVSAAMGGDAAALRGLQRAVEQRCQHVGFSAERRSFRPHVTLARSKAGLPLALAGTLARASQAFWPGPSFLAESFQLMRSELLPGGAQHTLIEDFVFTSTAA